MISLNAILDSKLEQHPFTYSIVENLLSKETVENLLSALPTKNYYRSVRTMGSDKQYDVVNNILLNLETNACDTSALPEQWLKLMNILQDKSYIQAISQLLQVDLQKAYQEITFKNYSNSHYLSPHTDKDYVIATHLIFLNLEWEQNWGGELQLHDPQQVVVKSHLPLWDRSFAFVRSNESWHSVNPVNHPSAVRRVIQVAFWKTNQRVVLPGREEIYDSYN